jgi:hypothetical protein
MPLQTDIILNMPTQNGYSRRWHDYNFLFRICHPTLENTKLSLFFLPSLTQGHKNNMFLCKYQILILFENFRKFTKHICIGKFSKIHNLIFWNFWCTVHIFNFWTFWVTVKILNFLKIHKKQKNTKKQEKILRILVKKSFQTSNICIGKF